MSQLSSPNQMRTQRLEAFSDGVFAIAITLLILEIAVPADAKHHLGNELLKEWPSYLAYVVSFSTIGSIWLRHSLITEYVQRADAIFVRINLLVLLVVAFLPFPTRLLAQYINSRSDERLAVTIYGATLLLASGLLSLWWRYAVREKLVRPNVADDELTALTQRLTPGLVGYVILIVVGLFTPLVAVIGFLFIALYFIVPFFPQLHSRAI